MRLTMERKSRGRGIGKTARERNRGRGFAVRLVGTRSPIRAAYSHPHFEPSAVYKNRCTRGRGQLVNCPMCTMFSRDWQLLLKNFMMMMMMTMMTSFTKITYKLATYLSTGDVAGFLAKCQVPSPVSVEVRLELGSF